jgi:hypothetical protein
MFNSKKTTLYGNSSKTSVTQRLGSKNAFLQGAFQDSAKTRSGNDALKYATTGNDFVDQFGKLAEYKAPRSYSDIANDIAPLYAEDALASVKFTFFIRMITRIIALFDNTRTKAVQRGAGLKNEGILRMIWLHINHPDIFWQNINLFISIGSWKDIITMMQYDLVYHGWDCRVLDWDKLTKVILAGLENPNTCNLVKKYLPQIKANDKCHTVESQADNMIAKYICHKLYGNDKEPDKKYYATYRKLKASGTAHQWQQLISQGKFLKINFDTIAGKALAQLVSGKFLANQGLEEKYEAWLAK